MRGDSGVGIFDRRKKSDQDKAPEPPVPVRPTDGDDAPVLTIESTRDACAGSAASYLLRNIAMQAGRLAPGIQDRLFFELHFPRFGASLDKVEGWFAKANDDLYRLGYRLGARRVAFRTEAICNWVLGGYGYRGAVLTINGKRLYPDIEDEGVHAVAITARPDGKKTPTLIMLDPWPGTTSVVHPPDQLGPAHRDQKYGTIVFYWSGWS